MEIPVTQLPPGDPRLVEAIVGQLKSKGIFDQFRKECLADVDTKPAFQNLRQRVEGHVNKFLEKKIWKNDMNKNQLRDGVRKHVNSLGILETGIDAIITQVVNPKIKPLILPYVEDTVYAFLQIDKPKRGRNNDSELETSPVPCKEEEMEEKKIKAEEIPESKPPLLPMETDVISSEEDDILARESPDGDKKSSSSSESDVAIDENARDGFENSPEYQENTPEEITANVERLHLSEEDSKSPQTAKPPRPLFDDQSLDSISSNSSGLTFSPLTDKGSPESKKSLENTPKSDDNSKADARSATSTPLVDEKPVDESSQSSLASDPSKEFAPSEKTYPTDKMIEGEPDTSTPSQSSDTSNARSAKDGESAMSVDDEDSRESKESISKVSQVSEKTEVKSEVEEKAKSEKSEGEISSSGSELSDVESKSKPETSHSDEKNPSDYDSSHKSRSKSDHKRRHDSYSRDRDREKDKDSRHHRDKERKRSKSRDDHHSHRDKDKKYHRRDKDHDGDKDCSRSHHHQSSSSHKESSGSSRNSGDRDKDRSSHYSGGKSYEGKSRSKQSGEKTEAKSGEKTEAKSGEKTEAKSGEKTEAKSGSKTDTKSDDKVLGKSHGKDDAKHDKKHSERRSDSKHDGKRDKRSVERTKETSDGRQDKTSEGKPESKSRRKTEEIDNKFDGKSHKSGRDSSSSRHKRTDGSGQNNDSKKRKHSHKSKNDEKDTLNGETCITEAKSVPSENLEKKEAIQNGESTINAAHMLGFDNDNIIVADEEGNLMLLTYEDDTDSVSSECPTKVKSEDSSCSETLPVEKESLDSNYFEGFENAKGDQRLADYLLTAKKVPDEMDMEFSELFDESDLHITLTEDAIKEATALSNFLKCMQQLGAVIKNEKGEVEDQSAKPIDNTDAKEKKPSQIGKKRRLSNSSSISSSSSSTGSPKHKRYRRESSIASDTSQMLEQDSVIVSGYALLTPEDDGNRSMGREYDLDYSQKMSNYSPLSPVSDSSADEGKNKSTGTALKPSVTDTKQSSEIDHKTEMWASEEAKLSV